MQLAVQPLALGPVRVVSSTAPPIPEQSRAPSLDVRLVESDKELSAVFDLLVSEHTRLGLMKDDAATLASLQAELNSRFVYPFAAWIDDVLIATLSLDIRPQLSLDSTFGGELKELRGRKHKVGEIKNFARLKTSIGYTQIAADRLMAEVCLRAAELVDVAVAGFYMFDLDYYRESFYFLPLDSEPRWNAFVNRWILGMYTFPKVTASKFCKYK